jgi:diguanylate cyclase (GGDEF)-like protein
MASRESDTSVPVLPNGKRRRLIVIVWIFAAMVLGLFAFAYASISLLSAVRAYVGGEGLWSKGQKDAIYALSRYTLYADEADYQNYLAALAVNQGDHLARLELEKSAPDLNVARAGLAQGRNHPDDISGMIFLFRRLRSLPEIDKAISIWKQADDRLERLTQVGERIRAKASVGGLSREQSQQFLTQLHDINAELTPLEDEFSATLSAAARKYTFLILLVMAVVVSVALAGAFVFSRRLVLQYEAVQDALQMGKKQLEDVLQFAPLPILIIRSSDETVAYINDHALAQFQVRRADVDRMRARNFYVNSADRDRLIAAAQGTGTVRGLELHLKDANGKPFWAQYSSQRVNYDDQDCLMTALINIDEKKRVHDDLHYRAYHDELTGLPNRAMFMDAFKRTLGRMERKQGMCSILFMDLDHFKEVNDQLGHEMGDLLLQQVAQRIQACVRASDLVARLAGDEFVVLIEEHDNAEDARGIAQKILQALERSYDLNGHVAHVTASIGISRYPQDGVELNRLLSSADMAMYQAKTQGKNNVQFYSREDS